MNSTPNWNAPQENCATSASKPINARRKRAIEARDALHRMRMLWELERQTIAKTGQG